MEKENRIYRAREFRTDGQDGKIIEGHAAVFGQMTNIGDCFYEVIEHGAFNGCDISDAVLVVNHDERSLPLARTQSGTLTLKVDDVGLAIRAKLDVENNLAAKALWSAVNRGDIRGMSFSFQVDAEEWQDIDSEMPTRHITKIRKIFDVSAATFPAYEVTDISARAKVTLNQAHKELTEKMRQIKLYEEEDERTKAFREYEARKAKEAGEKRAEQPPQYVPGKGFISAGERSGRMIDDLVAEQRTRAGEALKRDKAVQSPFNAFGERRTMTVIPPTGAASIVVPSYTSENITPAFPVVSSLIDSVAHLSLQCGESFKQPYVTGIAAGDYTGEGEDAAEAETQFDFAPINRAKITAYAELTEELEKLPAAAYADVVFQNIRTSMRKLLTKEILLGKGLSDDGTQHRLVGIFSDKATAIAPATDISISQITDTTLDEILFKYGGDEEVESQNVLILNKLDLLAFSKVRSATSEKFYDIQFDGGNGGTINGVRFIVNSSCVPVSMNGATNGDYCMAYGNLNNYQLVEFSNLEVRRSDDFKFRSGIACFKGSVFVGGNVVKRNGFLRVKIEK